MNILITGANGFISGHLIKRLIVNNNVYGLSRNRQSSGEGFELIYIDLCDGEFETALPTGIDCVIHLAQSSGYRNFPGAAHDIYRVNVEATFRLLEWSRINKVKHFIFASTANVYSASSSLLDEQSQTVPNSFYGASKYCSEQFVRLYQQYFTVDILRLFTVYGPRQRDMLFPTIVDRMRSGAVITLAKGVGIYFTPIYVNDVLDAVNALVCSPCEKEIRILNLCGNQTVSLYKVIQELEGILNIKPCIQITDDAPLYFKGNNEKLKQTLPDLKFTSLKSGLKKTFSLD